MNVTPIDTRFLPGDILVAAMPDGTYQISRVPTNGRSEWVLGFQRSEPAALRAAWGATSAAQRVFLRPEIGSGEYRLAEVV